MGALHSARASLRRPKIWQIPGLCKALCDGSGIRYSYGWDFRLVMLSRWILVFGWGGVGVEFALVMYRFSGIYLCSFLCRLLLR